MTGVPVRAHGYSGDVEPSGVIPVRRLRSLRAATICGTGRSTPKAVVIVSANMEWKAVKALYPTATYETTPWGEAFERSMAGERVVIFHGGWGKVAAAGSAQYAIDRWRPRYVVNLGTAGGFAGAIEKHAVVLVDYQPAEVYILEEQIYKYGCRCGELIITAVPTEPPKPIPGAMASSSLLAQLGIGKVLDGNPGRALRHR